MLEMSRRLDYVAGMCGHLGQATMLAYHIDWLDSGR